MAGMGGKRTFRCYTTDMPDFILEVLFGALPLRVQAVILILVVLVIAGVVVWATL